MLLLHSLGIPKEVLLEKQTSFLHFLDNATKDPTMAFAYLCSINETFLAEKLLMDGLEPVSKQLKKFISQEQGKMINKRGEQKCRILVPSSRLLFGVCDHKDVLKPGECFVRVTLNADGRPRTITGANVLIARNPCLHPGDLRKLRAVDKPELSHLSDCIVFSTRGPRPAADMMSGGDLDGDTCKFKGSRSVPALIWLVFVCWDKDLIPTNVSEPAEYPGGKEKVSFKPITSEDRIEYFARYTSASLGRVKKLFLGWARYNGPLSSQCQELNRLFSLCVDANKITVPRHLEDPPPPVEGHEPFILDSLHEAALAYVSQARKDKSQMRYYVECDSLEVLENSLCDGATISTFELAKIAFRWCKMNRVDFGDMVSLIDLEQLSHEERLWLLGELPPLSETASRILNGLLQSHILRSEELRPYRLNYQGLHWKCVFRSDEVRLGSLFEKMGRYFELFEKKLLVLRVNERFSIAIYIPKKIPKEDDYLVADSVRLFAFPQSHPDMTGHRRLVSTKIGYRLYYDNSRLELYNNHRRDTFVFLNRSQNNDKAYKDIQGAANRARVREKTIVEGINYDWRASIALEKFSSDLQQHIGRVNREGILAAVSS